MLNLLKNGEIVGSYAEGSTFKHEHIHVSPALPGPCAIGDDHEWMLVKAPEVEIPAPVVDLQAYAADARWRAETGGINVGNVPIYTDDRSKLLISGMRNSADKNPAYTTQFVTAAGDIVTLDAEQVAIISDAVSAHVSDVFKKYALVVQRLKNGSITAAHEIETIFFG